MTSIPKFPSFNWVRVGYQFQMIYELHLTPLRGQKSGVEQGLLSLTRILNVVGKGDCHWGAVPIASGSLAAALGRGRAGAGRAEAAVPDRLPAPRQRRGVRRVLHARRPGLPPRPPTKSPL